MAAKFFETLDHSAVSDEDRENIYIIARNIASKNCVLFMGAGVNACPDEYLEYYPKAHHPPMGVELCDILIKDLNKEYFFGDHNDKNLSLVAEFYRLTMGDGMELYRVLKEHIQTGKRHSPLLELLAEMPFEYVMTTNYDHHFETALRSLTPAKEPKIGIYQRTAINDEPTPDFDEKEISETTPYVFKVHGDIEVPSSIVISDEDYVQFLLRMRDKESQNPVPRTFRDALAEKSTLFIGNRLMDYNIRLLYKILYYGRDIVTKPQNFAIDPFPDSLIRKVVTTNYKTIYIIMDAWKVLPLLKIEIDKRIEIDKLKANAIT